MVSSVSVVIPTLNRPRQLAELICALTALPDAHLISEIIVVDQSDPGSPAPNLASGQLSLRYLRRSYRNISRARNEGSAAAKAEFLLFIDDDCRPMPGCLSAHIAGHASPGVGIVTGPYMAPGTPVVGRDELETHVYRELIAGRGAPSVVDFVHVPLFAPGGNLSCKRDQFNTIGGFDERLSRFNEDAEFCHRMKRSGLTLRYEPKAAMLHLHASNGGNRYFDSDAIALQQMMTDAIYFHRCIDSGARGIVASLWRIFRGHTLNRRALLNHSILSRGAVFGRAALTTVRKELRQG